MTGPAGAPPPRKVAASWFLGFFGVLVLVLLWLRGLLRPMLPVLIVVALALVVVRAIKVLRAPVD